MTEEFAALYVVATPLGNLGDLTRRDCSPVAAPDLHYSMAAEILFLIETLERADGQRQE